MDHPIHFMFGSRVGFNCVGGSNGATCIFYFQIQDISGMDYPSDLHETERSFAGIWERIIHEE